MSSLIQKMIPSFIVKKSKEISIKKKKTELKISEKRNIIYQESSHFHELKKRNSKKHEECRIKIKNTQHPGPE